MRVTRVSFRGGVEKNKEFENLKYLMVVRIF
jgi:hypothetical protein